MLAGRIFLSSRKVILGLSINLLLSYNAFPQNTGIVNRLDPSGRSRYKVTYTVHSKREGLLDRLNPLWKDRIALSSSYERQGDNRFEQEYFSVDFSRLQAGPYYLTVEVKDKVSGETRQSRVRFELVNSTE